MREIPAFLLAQAIAPNPLTASLHTPLNDVIGLMAQVAIGQDSSPLDTPPLQSSCVVILGDDGQPAGLLTEQDIVKLISVHRTLSGLTVAEVRAQPAFVLSAEEMPTVMGAIALMGANQVDYLPVVNAQQELIGLLTLDGLRKVLEPADYREACQVLSVMTTPAVHAFPTESLFQIVQKLARHEINCVVIVQANQSPADYAADSLSSNSLSPNSLSPIGVISTRDILDFQRLALTSAQALFETQAEAIMSAPLFVVQQTASLELAYGLMCQNSVHQLVVLNAEGYLVGLVAEDDLQPVHPLELHHPSVEKLQDRVSQLELEVAQLESQRDDLQAHRNRELEKLVVKNYTQLKRREQMINSLALGVGITTGENFWPSLVSALSKALQLDYALVGKLEDGGQGSATKATAENSQNNSEQVRITPLAMSGSGQVLACFDYDLTGGPYQEVIAHQARFYPEEVQAIFPEEALFRDYHIEAYLGVALRDSAGQVIGLLLVLHCQALADLDFIEEVLSIFADRASAELERQQAEKAQKQLEAQFLRTQRLESIGTLASGIAHDLNNILTPIMGIAQLLPMQSPDLSAEMKRQLGVLEASAQRGADIVNQVLLFAKGGSGEREPVDIQSLILEVTSFANKAFSKSIDIFVDVPTHLWWVEGDATQIHQVLMNLCVNAHDAMPQGGELSLLAANVMFDQALASQYIDAQVGPYIMVRVTDTGVGIAPEPLERIFEPFFTTKRFDQGTGLGLSTVHSIARRHGGFVAVESSVGQGSQFEIYLPAVETAYPANQANEFKLPQGQGECILVVDDEAPIRDVIRNILEAHHYQVVVAVDGIDAIAQYTPLLPTVAVVLMDVTMPHLDGTSSLQILQEMNPEIRVIVTSGLPPSEQMMAQKGVAAFLKKPYTLANLLKTLRRVIDTP
ncbi:MAG: CBS domain-containing protein [Cyanobacteria bacterium J06598_3]